MRLMIAALVLVVAGGAANAAEPFPNWDVNKAALASTLDMLDSAARYVQRPDENDKDFKEEQAILDTDRNVLFNHFLAGEIKARNYLVTHWSGYTEYYQALCLQAATKSVAEAARLQVTPGVPSYLSLLMCVPDSFDAANSIISDASDLPPAVSQ